MKRWRQTYLSSVGKILRAKHVPICCRSGGEFPYAGEIKTAGGIFRIKFKQFASQMK